jgi:formiminotetrahydrofolate cyclodeaminase
VVAALGAATLQMAFAYAAGTGADRPTALLPAVDQRLGQLAEQCLQLAALDCAAFATVTAAYRLPKTSATEQTERRASIQAGLVAATEVPLALLAVVVEAMELAVRDGGAVNRQLYSDLLGGAELLQGAARCAALSVAINVAELQDQETAANADRRCADSLRAIEQARLRIAALVAGD